MRSMHTSQSSAVERSAATTTSTEISSSVDSLRDMRLPSSPGVEALREQLQLLPAQGFQREAPGRLNGIDRGPSTMEGVPLRDSQNLQLAPRIRLHQSWQSGPQILKD